MCPNSPSDLSYRNLNKTKPTHGFALVLSLLLLSLVLTLIISLSTLTSVESRQQSAILSLNQARQNALLALQISIGNAQKMLGPDTVITANASILKDTVNDKKNWLGVWASDGSSGPEWLVSGDETQNAEFAADTAELVGTHSATVSVVAPKVSINGRSAPSGEYAFWVSDLSQRARVNLVDSRISDTDYTFERNSSIQAPEYFGLASIPGFVGFATASEANDAGEALRMSLSQVHDTNDLELISGLATIPFPDYFHDLTAYSAGLLTNVVDGGMKKDLTTLVTATTSPSGQIYPNGPPWALLQDYFRLSNNIDNTGIQPEARNPTTTGGNVNIDYPSQHGVTPLILFWELGLEVVPDPPLGYTSSDTIPMYLRAEPIVVMLNPYDVTLKEQTYIMRVFSGGGSYFPASNNCQRQPSFVLTYRENSGNDTILTPHNSTSGAGNYGSYLNEWLPDFTGHGSGGDGRSFQENGFRVSFTTDFEPGEIKVFSLNQDVFMPGQTDDWLLELEEGDPQGYYATSQDISGSLQNQLTGSDYDALQANTASLIFRIRSGASIIGLYLDSVDDENPVNSKNLTTTQRIRLLVPPSSERVHIGAALKGPNDLINSERTPTSTEGVRLLANYNPRSSYQHSIFSSSDPRTDFESSATYSPRADTQSFYNGIASLWDPAMIDTATGDPRIVLYHLARESLFSIAELQHADLSRDSYTPAYAIGNSLASPWLLANSTLDLDDWLEDQSYLLNQALWDDYFFSSLKSSSASGYETENSRIHFVNAASTRNGTNLQDSDRAAEELYIDGPFNINSVSVDAWTAFLASGRGVPVELYDIISESSELEDATGTPYARIGYPTGGSVPALNSTNENADDNDDQYWRGYRDLTDSQIRNLAGHIVDQIRTRGPFYSIADFINRNPSGTTIAEQVQGPLQAAIDAQMTITVDGTDYPAPSINPQITASNSISNPSSEVEYRFPEAVTGLRSSMAPGYLSQADILAKLGSQITTRGDTFLVRAYGNTIDPISGEVIAHARCEAVLQRYPEFLIDDSQPIYEAPNPNNQNFGRRIKVVSFRWLNESEY